MKILLGLFSFFLFNQLIADVAKPEQLVRRLYIDLFERLPQSSEVVIGKDKIEKGQYEKLVDEMLAGDEFKKALAHRITLHYSPNLADKRNASGEVDPKYFKRFIRMRKLVEKKYLDKSDFRYFVKDLAAGRGIATAKPALFFYDQQESIEQLTGRFADRVLGIPLKCAQCHNHRDYRDLYQMDFWGLAAFFKNTEIVDLTTHGEVIRIPSRNKFNLRTISALMDHEDYRPFKNWYQQERKGQFIFDGEEYEFKPQSRSRIKQSSELLVNQLLVLENRTSLKFFKIDNPDDEKEKFSPLLIGEDSVPYKNIKPRDYLATWLVSNKNPFLKKSVTNWVSNWIFGRGFKMPLNDIYGEGLNDTQLDEYSEFLLKNKFNISLLVKKMVTSDFYMKAPSKDFNLEEVSKFEQRALKQIPAKVIMKLAHKKEKSVKDDFDSAISDKAELISYFPLNEDSCDSSFKGTVSQSLYLSFNEKLRGVLINETPIALDPELVVKESIMKLYSRTAKDEEVTLLSKILKGKQGQERVSALNDILWILINSPEMRLY